ncbi:MAG: helix-turn-helix transcriptional regulator [Sphingomonas sp.]|nr:helix-turn-helix transcriptional regulator [Sphingomonas sp.]
MLKDILTRIDRRLVAKNLAESAAATKAGLSNSAIRNMRRAVKAGKNQGASIKTIEALAPVLGTSSAWLLEERGPEEGDGSIGAPIVEAKLISWISAGQIAQNPTVQIADLEYAPTVYAPDLDPEGDWIALRVDGDSMNRISPHDSIIFVNRKDRRLVPNACYVIGDGDGGATYKRYRPPNSWAPVSTNKAHQPFILPAGVDPDIIGRVKKTILSM